jgi:5-methylcytosine-specific restriction endonuclease McrA
MITLIDGMDPKKLRAEFGEYTIDNVTLMFRHHQIDLQPGFQRRSVWTSSDRRRLVQSIMSNYPLPSIFLYKRETRGGRLVYAVIDGKQRLETILMFTREGRFKRDAFDVRLDLGDGRDWIDWRDIKRWYPQVRAAFTSYKLQIVEVTGDLSQIVDLFVRINSTGKPLTSGEKRNARFYNSPFLKEADYLVGRFKKYLLKERVLSQMQLDRMKGTELFSELLMSIHQGGIMNKKTSVDRAIGNDSVNGNTLRRISKECVGTMNTMKQLVPDIRQTRFHNTVDFYSLFMLIWEMRQQQFVLKDRKRTRIAHRLLVKLSLGVDELRDQLRNVKAVKPQPPYSEYLYTIQGDTDSSATRERRAKILRDLLFPLFDRKDERRIFSAEQRRIIWNTDANRVCRGCKKTLKWDDFTVDHLTAWARGGRTSIENSQLMCASCNSRKRDR